MKNEIVLFETTDKSIMLVDEIISILKMCQLGRV